MSSEQFKAQMLQLIEDGRMPWNGFSSHKTDELDFSNIGGGRAFRFFDPFIGKMEGAFTPENIAAIMENLPEPEDNHTWVVLMFYPLLQRTKCLLLVEVGPDGKLPEKLLEILNSNPTA